MRFEILLLLALAVAFVCGTVSLAPKNEKERFILTASSVSFSTFTLIKSTTTTTSTIVLTTTCTTSTAIILTCTTGRRRRGLFYDETEALGRHRRAGLFYNDDGAEGKEGVSFLPAPKTTISDPVVEVPVKSVSIDQVVPLEIESGFSLPEGTEANRFLLAFGVSTRTSVVISTSTISLTAICSSTTGFPLCGSSGK